MPEEEEERGGEGRRGEERGGEGRRGEERGGEGAEGALFPIDRSNSEITGILKLMLRILGMSEMLRDARDSWDARKS